MYNKKEQELITEGILFVRDTGLTNMFDTAAVIEIAELEGYDLTADFIRNHKREYGEIIFTGEFPDSLKGDG